LWQDLLTQFPDSSPLGVRTSMAADARRLTVIGRTFSVPQFGATGIVRTYRLDRRR
jgi:hypothetical protein